MKIARFSGLAAFAAAALLVVGSSSQAAFVPLPSNVGALLGNSAVVGDKTFNFVSYTNTQNPVGGGSPIAPGAVSVNAIPGPPIGFELSGPIAAVPNTVNSNDILLQYTVTAPGSSPISAVTLTTNGNTSGSGFTEVVESVFTNNNGGQGTFLGQIAVIGGGSATLSLGGLYSSLYIKKDIQFDVFSSAGTASFSFIDQTFTQVPEPASVVMMGLGLVGAIGAVRLRRKVVVA